MNPSSKAQIRKLMRARRSALSAAEQEANAAALAQQALSYAPLLRAERIASYRAFGGEIGTEALEPSLSGRLYLPRITDFKAGEMKFYQADDNAEHSTLGILEPSESNPAIEPASLDLVLVPLVAFHRSGARLGMGAGFYDRAFAFRRAQPDLGTPLLIGLAHNFQECEELEADAWDVPLDAIITNQELIHVKREKP